MQEFRKHTLHTVFLQMFLENVLYHNEGIHWTREHQLNYYGSSKEEEIVSDVDISNGVESVPIAFCNEIDNRKLPQFKYRKTMWPRAYYLNSFSNMFTDSCDCSEGCVDMWVEEHGISKKIFWM